MATIVFVILITLYGIQAGFWYWLGGKHKQEDLSRAPYL